MNLRSSLSLTGALIGASVVLAPMGAAAPSPGDPGEPKSMAAPLTEYVMERDGKSRAQAEKYLETKDEKQQALRSLEERGVDVDGAWFEGTQLVVGVPRADAAEVRAAGLRPSTATSQSELDSIADAVLERAGKDSGHVLTVGANLPDGVVDVRVAEDAPRGLRQRLDAMKKVSVSTGEALATQADVVPGRIMDLSPGTNCSLGYPGRLSNGNNVLLTAGHCVEGMPSILDANGTHIGEGVHTRFRSGYSSVDMGLMDIDSEDTGVPYVDSRGHSGYYGVQGMSKNAIGSEICKAGNTTGWTCGQIKAYNRTVNYGGTVVSGLAEASVCTEGGDSGGAYIGVGNLAQGMTSGGPVGVECGWNRDYSAGSYSFFQPVVDAANYYGVTIDTVG
ncbi:S1 family peptidase [Janibacter sp. DB-40]|uniref:S1 family peptidase n=1 Tax=Janibacter sp. DB-40 TaxID=3028808 RepID=UPI0024074A80|nr:S1 family peptidase [Janibacter sp. DB-40]